MSLFKSAHRHKRLGIAADRHDYDLPFHDDRANRFLILLIGLMTYLALLAAAAGLVLTGMADRWNTGLANHLTIEIPGVGPNGARLTPEQHQEKTEQIRTLLNREGLIKDMSVQTPTAVGKLVEPWLGASDKILGQVPLPTLITVVTVDDTPASLKQLKDQIARLSPDIRVETHQSWLQDVLRLTDTLSFAAYLIGLITAVTTVSAVAGAVRARMTAYQEQLEILHLIGAADDYITGQFGRHAWQLSMSGAGAGFILAMITFIVIDQLAGAVELTLVPSLILSQYAFILLLFIPILTCLITVFTTRYTVKKTLEEMP